MLRAKEQKARPEQATGWDIRTQGNDREKWRGILSSNLSEKGWEGHGK